MRGSTRRRARPRLDLHSPLLTLPTTKGQGSRCIIRIAEDEATDQRHPSMAYKLQGRTGSLLRRLNRFHRQQCQTCVGSRRTKAVVAEEIAAAGGLGELWRLPTVRLCSYNWPCSISGKNSCLLTLRSKYFGARYPLRGVEFSTESTLENCR